MKVSRRLIVPAFWSLILLAFVPAAASACSVCMGANSKAGGAINGAIFLMLGVLVVMLGSIGAFIFNLRKRAAQSSAAAKEDDIH